MYNNLIIRNEREKNSITNWNIQKSLLLFLQSKYCLQPMHLNLKRFFYFAYNMHYMYFVYMYYERIFSHIFILLKIRVYFVRKLEHATFKFTWRHSYDNGSVWVFILRSLRFKKVVSTTIISIKPNWVL